MIPAISTVSFCRKDIDCVGIKSVNQRLLVSKSDYLRTDIPCFQPGIQHSDHGTVQHTDPFAGQALKISRYIRIIIVLYQVVGFITHRCIRKTNHIRTILSPGKPCQKINLSVQQHLIQFPKAAVNILILPAGVFRDFSIILVGITGLDSALRSTFLKYLVLIITDTNGF